MPDWRGILTNAEIQTVIDRLRQLDDQRGSTMKCPICSSQSWTVKPHVLGLQSTTHVGALIGPEPSQRLVMVTCNSCSHSHFFDAAAMGIRFLPLTGNALAAAPLFGPSPSKDGGRS